MTRLHINFGVEVALVLHRNLMCLYSAPSTSDRHSQNELVKSKLTATLAIELVLNEITAAIAQLGERQTEDLKVPGSMPGLGILSCCCF